MTGFAVLVMVGFRLEATARAATALRLERIGRGRGGGRRGAARGDARDHLEPRGQPLPRHFGTLAVGEPSPYSARVQRARAVEVPDRRDRWACTAVRLRGATVARHPGRALRCRRSRVLA